MMDIVYRSGSATANDVLDQLPDPPSYSAVRTTLRILEEKGLLKHELDGKRYVYRPRLPRDKARKGAMEHLVSTFFGGSASGAVLAPMLVLPGLSALPKPWAAWSFATRWIPPAPGAEGAVSGWETEAGAASVAAPSVSLSSRPAAESSAPDVASDAGPAPRIPWT